jgi:hypothetical protein
MKAKDSIFKIIQIMLAYQAEIRDVFLVFATPNRAPILAADDFEPCMTHVLLLQQAGPESGITAPEYGPQDAVAGLFRAGPPCFATQSDSLALRAGFSRHCDGFRMVPIKTHELFLSIER